MLHSEAQAELEADETKFSAKVKSQVAARSLGSLNGLAMQVRIVTFEFEQMPEVVKVETVNFVTPIIDKTLLALEMVMSGYKVFRG